MKRQQKMRVVGDGEAVPADLEGAVIALGNFDGVHRGHQAVLSCGGAIANDLGTSFGVMTFDPHPRSYFSPSTALFTLSPLERKFELLDCLGIEFTSVLTFDETLAGLTAEAFVKEVLVDKWQAAHVIVGYNFMFGKGRSGTPQTLSAVGGKMGFGVTIIEPESRDGQAFSSSAIRELLRAGHVRDAADILGYWWTVSGTVEHGAGRGHNLGYPTVNVMLQPGQDLHHGIYAARVWVDGHRFDAAAYNGRRPTFDNGLAKLEAFLFDFNESLYGHQIDVELIDFLRPDEAFDSAEALTAQIGRDCAAAKEILVKINSADPMLNYPIGRSISAFPRGTYVIDR